MFRRNPDAIAIAFLLLVMGVSSAVCRIVPPVPPRFTITGAARAERASRAMRVLSPFFRCLSR